MVVITEKEFKQLSQYIKSNYGIHLSREKMTLVTGRLNNVLQQAECHNFTDYYNHIVADKSGGAAITLVDKITTNHTFFMREADHFYYFRDKVLPFIVKNIKDKDLRIWCAASSSGEESYTLAMILDEFFGEEKMWWDTKVLATDISERVLDIAKKGIYSNERIAPLPLYWRTHYFKQHDRENAVLVDKIKNEVIYRKFNLMDTVFPFKKKFHTIFCRNVMIYFDNETRTKLVNRFYDHLEDGGYLFIGHSESLNKETTKFKYVMPSVYRKV
ncbi:CheR family methyltransferase [Cellulosilyticum sp. I15G10I2]|uniref:CheR family methyltransferase n=1 Tax=Cellulosilyticum sp. I15G10I2 TaxID=1892843 RepID=UPI00085BB2C4|nr:protein-glutamate O-methyltransferase CheR [Cellulosilyticum sp. I15G10I2]